MKTRQLLMTAAMLLMPALTASAQLRERDRGLRETNPAFYQTDEARRIGDQVLLYQRVTGGWPQFWPDPKGYQVHITFNDDAMVHTLELLRDIGNSQPPYQDIADKTMKKRMQKAFALGIECILKTQIVSDGQLTVWCQQHYRDTYLPAPARAFELPSYCSAESAAILRLLMSLPKPDDRVKKAVNAGMLWLDRDGIPRHRMDQIGHERRNGYGWYLDRVADLYPIYEAWADKYDPKHKADISLTTKGGNENGTLQLNRQALKRLNDFDAVVQPGQSIQQVIEQAPARPDKPYKILIRKGLYEQKVIIDRPNIVLVGEQRDSTILRLAELSSKRTIKEYKGQPVGNGVLVLQEGADDCVISGLTVYNNYGTTVEPTTAHQMAIFGRATRTIIVNSNVWADGNDALSLWAREGNGMYYHADLDLRCAGVDFLCPRGWCYVTRSRFLGDGHAIIWHDGRGDPDKKLVIVDSQFDAKRPTQLGRYHHDSQFVLVHCQLSANILDENIRYAYTDKVLDPCPWGQRTYYWACSREGGQSGWLDNNLRTAPGAPEYHTVTARWTFGDRWDPEARIRDLWNIIAY